MTDLSARALRVAMSGIVPADDPHIIADLQAKIETDAKVIAALRGALQDIVDHADLGGMWCGALAQKALSIEQTAEEKP